MSAIPDEIERRLTRWGRLARGRYEEVCLSDRSVLARMIEEGPGACQVGDWASAHLPDDAVETDQAVARQAHRYRRALKIHYLTELPTEVKAALLRTSRANFYLWVNAGKTGVFVALEKIGHNM